jgi:argininosuccinate lyase
MRIETGTRLIVYLQIEYWQAGMCLFQRRGDVVINYQTPMNQKLWQKGKGLREAVEKFETAQDLALDQHLIPYDVQGSLAHAKGLHKIGILTKKELSDLEKGLAQILANGLTLEMGDEDMHTKIEQYLTDHFGDVGKKIHTGRSRNDQVLTALRLFSKDMLSQIIDEINVNIKTTEAFIDQHGEIPMPGYTHMQRAMPASLGIWMGSMVASFRDDLHIIQSAVHLNDQSPLGSAAGYGVPLELDRAYTAKLMGFSRVQENPMYCQNSRGKIEAQTIAACVSVFQTINKLTSDVLFFTTTECGFFSVEEDLCSGSSIMPQKKNIDIAELLRSKLHLVSGYYTQMVGLSGNLISGYNRDLQDAKKPLYESLTTTLQCVQMTTLLINGLHPNEQNLRRAMTDELYATHRALELVQSGVPFREAYRRVKKSL